MRRVVKFCSVLLGMSLSACANTGYYFQAINGQLLVLEAKRPIADVIADPAAPPTLKEKLAAVQHIRAFAGRALGLPNGKSYRHYADLRRRYVLWNVFAAPEFSVQPNEWCLLFAGCVNYRGYFFEDGARAYAERLRAQGYDVFVGGVPAYSTLGWFGDPVLNTFIHYPEQELAQLLFHELAHQIVFVPGDTMFNESFATAVQQEGMRRWLDQQGDAAQRAAYQRAQQRQRTFINLVLRYRGELEELYARDINVVEKRAAKARILRELQTEFDRLRRDDAGLEKFAGWFSEPPNNAQLASLVLYTQWVPAFQALLAQCDDDLPRFYEEVKALAKLAPEARAARLTALTEKTANAS